MRIAGVTLNFNRALAGFLFAYIAITIVGTLLSFAIAAVLHTPATVEPLQNQAYVLSEPFLPWLNLLLFMAGAWIYFRKLPQEQRTRNAALLLGASWLLIALPLDFVLFVVIKTPISLNSYDFYVGQFPWIYLIYIAVLFAPVCYWKLLRTFGRPAAE